jgi:hypothetical protein
MTKSETAQLTKLLDTMQKNHDEATAKFKQIISDYTRMVEDIFQGISHEDPPKKGYAALPYERRCEVARKAALTRKRKAAAKKAAETKRRNKC